ncbi:hypothetical protein [Roseateles amylovorans]|uniref:Uncharacterized protein n=1 Tax=Roseateles amylovorans TaxID=2978473 RepID=A0ABY6B033_9BURK|nr:hypothetical protein [Roseateles amylovorans]UXH78776.1 hypothetical protein N4261_02210 [Roseateles amylovorans]
MDQDFDQLQGDYLAALRPVVDEAKRWWAAHTPSSHLDLPASYDRMDGFRRRWTTGPAGHPRVLAVFREYYFRTHDLNVDMERRAVAPDDEALTWGQDVQPPDVDYRRPMDFLINDLASVAPDLFDVMQGLNYVPVGKNPMDNEEC